MSDHLTLRAGDAHSATLALTGAEPVAWRVAGRDYLWTGDPAHWNRHAPWLFPVVGASAGGVVRVGGREYPMPQHGFARDALFTVVAAEEGRARLRLVADDATRAHYPFDFALEIEAALDAEGGLSFDIRVRNPGDRAVPYALGFHPAFLWPFEPGGEDGYAVTFDAPQRPDVPEIAPGGLIAQTTRPIPLAESGRRLPLDRTLFPEAIVLRDAGATAMRFVAPSGRAIAMRLEDFPHLAIWTRATAPFLSLECWTGYADLAGFSGDLADRAGIRLLSPGGEGRHRVRLSVEE